MQILRQTVDRILEPRALWDIATLQAGFQTTATTQGVLQPAGRALLPPNNWRNGTRYTQVLTHICIAPVNYLIQRNNDASAKNTTNFNNSDSIVNRMKFKVTVPGLYTLSTEDLVPVAFTPKCVEPSMEFTSTPYASSLLGTYRWDFDFEAPFWLPRRARVQFDLSGWSVPFPPAFDASNAVVASVLFNELPMAGFADRIPGTSRLASREDLPGVASTTFIAPAGPAPFFSVGASSKAFAAGTESQWPFSFPPNVWDRQESSRGTTHSEYSGFAVAIDQLTYDDRMNAEAAFVGQPVTSIANRIAVRARTTNGGSNAWWWRPGVPLSLVTPTVGVSLVLKLEKPVVLAPGDAVLVEAQAPPLDQDVTQVYQVGISMLGYARIEA